LGHHGEEVGNVRHTVSTVTGGVMRLGKALATGVAEERELPHEEEPRLSEETEAPEPVAAEEVPVAR
jgi:hypothetical protein